ncbi:hypothetical protein ACI6PS_10210 [Flavobacterium sp. PLA-1-15]|uniref:hypothetical protein n=1 Tax=Flavobacterium sp. PLA-1-15 TaxID=3380533 RepID=UPI003B82B84F
MKNKSLSELNLEELYEKKKMLKSKLLVCACFTLIILAGITFFNLNEGNRVVFFIIPVCFILILPISNNLGTVTKEIKDREAR